MKTFKQKLWAVVGQMQGPRPDLFWRPGYDHTVSRIVAVPSIVGIAGMPGPIPMLFIGHAGCINVPVCWMPSYLNFCLN